MCAGGNPIAGVRGVREQVRRGQMMKGILGLVGVRMVASTEE